VLVEKIVSVLDMDNFDCTLQGFANFANYETALFGNLK